MKKWFLFTAVLAALVMSWSALGLAEDTKQPALPEGMPPMGPPKEMAACAEKVGTWDVATEMRMDPNSEFMQSTGVCTFSMVAGGAALQSAYSSNMMGMPYEGLGHTTYNSGTSQWMSTWVDNMGGYMSVYTGGLVDGKMVLTGKDIMGGQIWDTRVTEWPVKDGKFDFQIEQSADGGKTWAVYMKSVYTKRK
jgi:hypothetical protein